MLLSASDVRIVDVETCDFDLMSAYDTEEVLRAGRPDEWEHYLRSAAARRMIAELGVTRRYLTHMPGREPVAGRLTAYDLARSATERLMDRRRHDFARLDALIFVSTSNPHPCNSQAAMLAKELGLKASCMDLKAGCSGGVLGLIQAAMLLRNGCGRVLVVMAENLSHLTPVEDLRMLLTVGDGAACVLLERYPEAGFLRMLHGTEPEFAEAMMVTPSFPPLRSGIPYTYTIQDAVPARDFLHRKWRSLFADALAAAQMEARHLSGWFFHQTHAAQVDGLIRDVGIPASRTVRIVTSHGNMGTPTFAVAMAHAFGKLHPGERYLLQAVGGGISWCAIVVEHR